MPSKICNNQIFIYERTLLHQHNWHAEINYAVNSWRQSISKYNLASYCLIVALDKKKPHIYEAFKPCFVNGYTTYAMSCAKARVRLANGRTSCKTLLLRPIALQRSLRENHAFTSGIVGEAAVIARSRSTSASAGKICTLTSFESA